MAILGVSAFYHDSAAALVRDGTIVAAAQEERFSRKRHDARFPGHAIRYCLAEAGASVADLDAVVFYEKPLVKFERLIETYLAFAPRGIVSYLAAMPVWLTEKLFLKDLVRRELASIAGDGAAMPPILFTEHHESHAASAFYPSPFERAAVLCLDGVGEWATTSAWTGEGASLTPLWEIQFPHSLGLLYSAFTYYTGFRVNSGEHKLMGLAPYGEPRYVQSIYDHLIDLKEDGTFRLNMAFFNYCTGLTMTNGRFDALFGGPPRAPEAPLTARDMDLARSIQAVTEEVMLRLARTLHRETGLPDLCLAGGVALNCVGNGRILREGPFDRIWIQPAAGDAGGALGAALAAWHGVRGHPRRACGDAMRGSFLGPAFGDAQIERMLAARRAPYERLDDARLCERVARALADGQVVGWFQGRMEFGPRALGARSILGDPRSPAMQSTINLKIKFRESFRPFAPAALRERAAECFDLAADSPYMLLIAPVAERQRKPVPPAQPGLHGLERLRLDRSTIPAVTHVDDSARVQTVDHGTESAFLSAAPGVRPTDGLPGPRQHVLQRARRADRLHARRRVSLLHADRNGPAGPGAIGSGEARPATARGGRARRRVRGRLMRSLLRRMYAGWMTFARALAWVNARIILTVVFYLLLTPVGLVRRLLGYDPMSRRLERDAATYRVTREPRPSSHVEKQY